MALETTGLQKTVHDAGLTWIVRTPPATEHHGLGRLPSDPQRVQEAIKIAHLMLQARVRVLPPGAVEAAPPSLGPAGAGITVSVAAAAASLPTDMDWRTRGIIGPVEDQGWCGSCVSFCTTGLAAAMAWLELGVRNLTLSAADQHFCSSHGANCGGWNESDALGQIKSRGVVAEGVFSYMTAFDNPPKGDPNDVPDHLWLAYCRSEINRTERRWRITDYSAWPSSMAGIPFDARKYYLANLGPMAMGFTVYEDFDNYGGGVYKHVTGNSRGGHCVLVVGYSDTHQAWICRNSWGAGFGGPAHADGTGAGFFMIAYGDSNIDDTFYGCHGILVPPQSRLAQRVGDVDGDGITEVVVTSPWGIGILKQAGATMSAPMMAPNGTRFGGWLLNTGDNEVGPVADYDGDGHAEILVTSPWGIGILKLSGGTLIAPMMAPNGTHFGSWNLDTSVDEFGPVGDYDGDGRVEILVSSPSGVAILKLLGGTLTPLMTANNGTRFGGWLLDTSNNDFGPAADYDGDRHAEILVTSPWGIGILKLSGGALTAPMMQPNGTRFGGWLLNTADNNFGESGDYDSDGHAEILVTSPWGVGILKLVGATLSAPMMQPNGTRFGGWLVETADNQFGPAADYDGDGRVELLVTSSWGLGILKQSGDTMTAPMMAPNGARFGGWLLNTIDNQLGIAGSYAGGRQAEVLVTSPWGIGILRLAGATLTAPMMQPNGTRFGGWLLNTADNEF
jgi:Papain family cysteine protease/FG-GAP-like repeat/FG-GAP repeat